MSQQQPLTKLEQLRERMNVLDNIISEKQDAFWNEMKNVDPDDMSPFSEYEKITEVETKEYNKLYRQYRVLVDANVVGEIEKDCTLYTMLEFEKLCKSGGFIDYDGSGSYSDGKYEYDVSIYPSDIKVGNYRKDFSHVVWYNK